jgi:23S rRNA (adenine2503-C2)-methyltransferase
VEGVLLRYKHGNTLCVSTQVGCRMGCAFCASTLDGLARNVTAGEMHAMMALANARYARGDRRGATNIVLMGSGEPLDNYDNVLRAVRLAARSEGLGISPRNVSLSTCGLVEGMNRLAGEGLPLTLSLSLHAPNDEIRRKLMPVARRYAIEETLSAVRRLTEATGRRAVIEYTLVEGVNDAQEHARELAGRLRNMNCLVNLIPLNPVAERPELTPPKENRVWAFSGFLSQLGCQNTVRRSLGEDIQGACGQLRRRHMEEVKKE